MEIRRLKEQFHELDLHDPEAKWELDEFTPATIKTPEEKAQERKDKQEARKQKAKTPDARANMVSEALGQRLK